MKELIKAEHITIINQNEKPLIELVEADLMALDPTGGMVRRYHEVLDRPKRKFKPNQKRFF